MLVEQKSQSKSNTIKSEQLRPLISQNTQLTKLYIFHYDNVPWKFLGCVLEFVKVVSWIGVVYAMTMASLLHVYGMSIGIVYVDFHVHMKVLNSVKCSAH